LIVPGVTFALLVICFCTILALVQRTGQRITYMIDDNGLHLYSGKQPLEPGKPTRLNGIVFHQTIPLSQIQSTSKVATTGSLLGWGTKDAGLRHRFRDCVLLTIRSTATYRYHFYISPSNACIKIVFQAIESKLR
jgi:hypothetical protein